MDDKESLLAERVASDLAEKYRSCLMEVLPELLKDIRENDWEDASMDAAARYARKINCVAGVAYMTPGRVVAALQPMKSKKSVVVESSKPGKTVIDLTQPELDFSDSCVGDEIIADATAGGDDGDSAGDDEIPSYLEVNPDYLK